MHQQHNALLARFEGIRNKGKTIPVHTADTDVAVLLAGTFYDLIVNQTPIDTWDLSFGMDKLCRFYHINAICASLGTKNHEHYLSLTFWGWLWSQFGWHCRHIKTSLTHLCIWLVILTSCWMLMQTHSRTSKDLLSFCTTKPVVWAPLTRPEGKCLCHKNRALDKLSPTKDLLLQHIWRIGYKAAHKHNKTFQFSSLCTGFCLEQSISVMSTNLALMTYGWVFRIKQELLKCTWKGDGFHCKCGKANMGLLPIVLWKNLKCFA